MVDIAANLAFGTFLLLALAGEAVLWRRGAGRRQVGWGFASAGALALAFAIWNLAKDGSSLCHPDSLLQGHAAWHLLCAVAAYALYRLYASEQVSDAGLTRSTVPGNRPRRAARGSPPCGRCAGCVRCACRC